MKGDEEVRVVLVGNVRALLQGDKDIRRTRIHHFDVRILLFEFLPDLESQLEVEVFFFGKTSDCPGVFSSMSRVEDDGITIFRKKRQSHANGQQCKQEFTHNKAI